MLITVDSRTAWRFLRIYGIETPVAEARVSRDSQEIPLTIDGISDARVGPAIRVKAGKVRVSRGCPLTPNDAGALTDELQASGALPSDDRTARTVADVILRCAK
jgi:hypothetical protein